MFQFDAKCDLVLNASPCAATAGSADLNATHYAFMLAHPWTVTYVLGSHNFGNRAYFLLKRNADVSGAVGFTRQNPFTGEERDIFKELRHPSTTWSIYAIPTRALTRSSLAFWNWAAS
ncbi:hypothetical protein [Shinella granuli]|uniref:hypothetical protein n=1 Tax=Shinella granuli TaxID=323621 RepID=UPI00105684F1|nr:hypothetical protein [Shinella granuli]